MVILPFPRNSLPSSPYGTVLRKSSAPRRRASVSASTPRKVSWATVGPVSPAHAQFKRKRAVTESHKPRPTLAQVKGRESEQSESDTGLSGPESSPEPESSGKFPNATEATAAPRARDSSAPPVVYISSAQPLSPAAPNFVPGGGTFTSGPRPHPYGMLDELHQRAPRGEILLHDHFGFGFPLCGPPPYMTPPPMIEYGFSSPPPEMDYNHFVPHPMSFFGGYPSPYGPPAQDLHHGHFALPSHDAPQHQPHNFRRVRHVPESHRPIHSQPLQRQGEPERRFEPKPRERLPFGMGTVKPRPGSLRWEGPKTQVMCKLGRGDVIERTGRVKLFDPVKGFGFLLDDEVASLAGRDIFVHYTALRIPIGFRALWLGEKVQFHLVQVASGGYQALNVRGVDGRPLRGLDSPDLSQSAAVDVSMDEPEISFSAGSCTSSASSRPFQRRGASGRRHH